MHITAQRDQCSLYLSRHKIYLPEKLVLAGTFLEVYTAEPTNNNNNNNNNDNKSRTDATLVVNGARTNYWYQRQNMKIAGEETRI